MNYTQLAEVVISSLSSKPLSHKIGQAQENLARIFTFNFEPSTYSIFINKDLMLSAKSSKMVEGSYNVINEIKENLEESLRGDIEFIYEDQITKSLTIFTKDYVDSLINGETHLGELIYNYFKIWYISKVGPEAPMGAEAFATENQTFSPKERSLLNSLYMPIVTVPKELKPVFETMKMIIEISSLREYVLTEPAYNMYGKRCDGITFWIPRNIAQEYLKETEIERVLSSEIVKKLLTDAGLFGGAPIQHHEEITAGALNNVSSEEIERYILDQHQIKEQERERELKSFISKDMDVHDSKINKGAVLPKFNL